jgi:tripartite-type tricarboxylate transporter receptor subunit TctC
MMSKTLITRRQALAGTAGIALATDWSRSASAQTSAWPDKPVRVVVPYAPGGGADTLSRLLFAKMQEDLGQSFIIDNRAGGGGTIGPAIVAKSPNDGYTILHDATSFSVNPGLLPSLPFDAAKDFIPVFLAGQTPNLLVTHPDTPQKTVADIIATSKASAEGFSWASAGNGSVQHLAFELFKAQTGSKLTHIPFKGGGPAINDVMGGHVKFLFTNAAGATPHVKSGKLKAIAHTGTGRLASLPDLPSVADTLPGFEALDWNGVFLPAGTPQAIVDKLNAALNKVILAAAVVERTGQLSIQTKANTPAEFAAFVKADTEKWGKIIRDGNIKAE